MLRESPQVGQIEGEPRRRWFFDDEFDLIVWCDPGGRPVEFQLCYDKAGCERALTWRQRYGLTHGRVDTGDDRPGQYKLAPVIQPDHRPPPADLHARFLNASAGIESAVRYFVLERLASARQANRDAGP